MTILPGHSEQKINELQDYWSSIRLGNAVPSRADFYPEKVSALLPFITIDEYRSPNELYSRLRGSVIVSRFGTDLTGQNLTSLFDDASRDIMMKAAHQIVDVPCGGHTVWTAESSNGKQSAIQGCYLPMIGSNGEKLIIGLSIESTDKVWKDSRSKPIIAIEPSLSFFDIGFGIGQIDLQSDYAE